MGMGITMEYSMRVGMGMNEREWEGMVMKN
jgi:hypothetical protein